MSSTRKGKCQRRPNQTFFYLSGGRLKTDDALLYTLGGNLILASQSIRRPEPRSENEIYLHVEQNPEVKPPEVKPEDSTVIEFNDVGEVSE